MKQGRWRGTEDTWGYTPEDGRRKLSVPSLHLPHTSVNAHCRSHHFSLCCVCASSTGELRARKHSLSCICMYMAARARARRDSTRANVYQCIRTCVCDDDDDDDEHANERANTGMAAGTATHFPAHDFGARA